MRITRVFPSTGGMAGGGGGGGGGWREPPPTHPPPTHIPLAKNVFIPPPGKTPHQIFIPPSKG